MSPNLPHPRALLGVLVVEGTDHARQRKIMVGLDTYIMQCSPVRLSGVTLTEPVLRAGASEGHISTLLREGVPGMPSCSMCLTSLSAETEK